MIRNTLSLVSLSALLSTFSAFGLACGGNQAAPTAPTAPSTEHAGASAAASKGGLKEPGDAKVGDTSKCPVTGEEFTVEATSPKVEHEGKTYYFCCSGCKKKFEADPSKFTKKS